ncbi:hypothetical protein BX600DRAFT_436046 [Xylariales sp. PMI_506]|nr:hypothetical protein BX600DRAFT_436046 [Xylariales sp. PMI_506]
MLSFGYLFLTAALARGVAGSLTPLVNTAVNTTDLSNVVPTSNVNLTYGQSGAGHVEVGLNLNRPGVLLEHIDGISSVACSNSSVEISFSSQDAFYQSVAEWVLDTDLVLITNHLGNCDSEFERGIFSASGISSDNSTLTVTAESVKTDVAGVSSSLAISFSNLPLQQSRRRRSDLTLNDTTLSGNISLPADTTIFSDSYVTAEVDDAWFSAAVTFSGYLEYTIATFTLNELYFDVDTTLEASATVTVDVVAPYTTSFEYTAPSLSYDLVDVPGIVTIGPALVFDIGVSLDVEAAVGATAELTVEIPDGTIHLDLVNFDDSSAGSWTPTQTSSIEVTEAVEVVVTPYLGLTVEIEIEILSGILDLSSGLTASAQFPNDFTVAATETAGNVSATTSGCTHGFTVDSVFDFSLTAFVTEFWSDTLYTVEVPIADECYAFKK